MNPEEITGHLASLGHEARLSCDHKQVEVSCIVGGRKALLVHQFPSELIAVPKFDLVEAKKFGVLAHVVPDKETGLGAICVANADSISVNTDCPPIAYAASLKRHVDLIDELLRNPELNTQELLREFHSNWDLLCQEVGTSQSHIYFATDDACAVDVEIKQPQRNAHSGLCRNYFGLTTSLIRDANLEAVRRYARWSSRTVIGKAAYLNLEELSPAPRTSSELWQWYETGIDNLDDGSRKMLERLKKQPSKMFWLVFSASIPGGITWFALQFKATTKGRLPIYRTEGNDWQVVPYPVRSLSRESLVPRGGGLTQLKDRSVLLVGCGAVGSELAQRLTASGVGRLTVSDPDIFVEANLYRHMLSIAHLGQLKCNALAENLRLKHPWVKVDCWNKRLEELREADVLGAFDLILIAIGSPTIERIFHDYCRVEKVACPVLSCWVEAYGVGGHAILDVPTSKGCWRCAYVDPETCDPGLASNLNFLAPNQDLDKTHEGCGFQYLPFCATDASYTASMAADLAVRFMNNEINTSSMMSWKGSADKATKGEFELTFRYRNFSDSLTLLPLFNSECDVCGS